MWVHIFIYNLIRTLSLYIFTHFKKYTCVKTETYEIEQQHAPVLYPAHLMTYFGRFKGQKMH